MRRYFPNSSNQYSGNFSRPNKFQNKRYQGGNRFNSNFRDSRDHPCRGNRYFGQNKNMLKTKTRLQFSQLKFKLQVGKSNKNLC